MRMLIVMIGAWLMLSAFFVVAVINDKPQSWVSYLLGATVRIASSLRPDLIFGRDRPALTWPWANALLVVTN